MTTEEDRQAVIGVFDQAIYPHGAPSLDESWLGIYQTLMWHEHGLLHVREANDLRRNGTWQRRARDAELYIAGLLGVGGADVAAVVDRMMRLPRWRGMQRNNPLGNGLRILIREVLRRWGDPRFEYSEERSARDFFPGIKMPGRSEAPRMDVLATRKGGAEAPRAICSCKWSIRHDRISDPTNECQEYKAAAVRRQNMDMLYFVVTNELDLQRLDKVLNQPCVDHLVHLHLKLTMQLAGTVPASVASAVRSGKLMDLTDFVRSTFKWSS